MAANCYGNFMVASSFRHDCRKPVEMGRPMGQENTKRQLGKCHHRRHTDIEPRQAAQPKTGHSGRCGPAPGKIRLQFGLLNFGRFSIVLSLGIDRLAGEDAGEAAAPAGLAFDPQLGPVTVENLLDDGQPQPGAALAAGTTRFGPVKAVREVQ